MPRSLVFWKPTCCLLTRNGCSTLALPGPCTLHQGSTRPSGVSGDGGAPLSWRAILHPSRHLLALLQALIPASPTSTLSRHAILCGHRHILDVGVSDGHCMAQARVFLYPNLAFIPKKHWCPSGWRTSPDPALRKYQFCIRRIWSIPRQIGRPAPWGPTRGWKGSSSLSKTEKEKGAPATSQKPSPGVP